MKIAIVGSRPSYNVEQDRRTEAAVHAYVATLPKDTVIVSGGAKGVDTWATDAAKACGLPDPIVFEAEWDKYAPPPGSKRKNPAGMIRNRLIVNEADSITAFWDGSSSGTGGTINLARQAGKPVSIHPIE